MEARKKILILLLAAMTTGTLSAQRIWETRKGCIRTQGNLAGGYLFGQKQALGYINGDMDLFLEDRVAFTGAVWYSFPTVQKNQVGIRSNHAIFGGINYHFLKPSRWDPYIGLTPGLGVVEVSYREGDNMRRTPYTPIPLLSAAIGFNYYVGSIFHFFVKIQGVTGQVFSTLPSPARVDELKFMAGLGWNLRLWKPKNKDKWRGTNS